MLGVTEAVDSVMMNIGAFFSIAGGIIMMLFVVGMVGYLVALLWISACNKWRAICRAESLIFEYRKNRKDFLRWMSKADTIAAEKKAADVRLVVRGRWRWVGQDQWNDCYECSQCGKMNTDNSNFCPNCGADMRGGTTNDRP
jgi:hypothetical protein